MKLYYASVIIQDNLYDVCEDRWGEDKWTM